MSKYKVYDYFKELPKWAQGIVIVGGGLIAWFGVINPTRKLIISKLNAAKMAREGKEAGEQLAILKKQGIKPTINEAQAESFANSLAIAFSGCGTDEPAIFNVMSQLKNDADVYLLIKKYGTRKYENCFWAGKTELSLSGAISDELDTLDKKIVNEILKKNKVRFQFT